MRALNYKAEYQKLLTPELVSILMQIHELKAKNEYLVKKGRTFSALIEMAKIQSTEASNRIEGIVTTSERLEKLMKEKTMPKNRSEEEIAGYRDVLNTIHESYFFRSNRTLSFSCTAIYTNSAVRVSAANLKILTM